MTDDMKSRKHTTENITHRIDRLIKTIVNSISLLFVVSCKSHKLLTNQLYTKAMLKFVMFRPAASNMEKYFDSDYIIYTS